MIEIRKPNLEPKVDGIPKDFADVRDYFNKALQEQAKTFHWIPRKTKITNDEITKLWIPSLDTNICLVAELNKSIIGSATCFFDPSSTAYEQAQERKIGEIGLSVNPERNHRMVGYLILEEMIKELKGQGKKAFFHTDSKFDEEIWMMKDFGYEGTLIEDYERYKKAGLSGKVYEYELP